MTVVNVVFLLGKPCIIVVQLPGFSVLRAAALMSDIYQDHKDEDGFLYITYSGENTFGFETAYLLVLLTACAERRHCFRVHIIRVAFRCGSEGGRRV